MLKKSIFIIFLLVGILLPIPLVRATEPKQSTYFEYPTETWIIEKQDYFGQFLEWDFIPVDGQHSDKRVWNFTWRHLDYLEIYNETGWIIDYVENPVYRIRNGGNLTEIYGDIKHLAGFKNWGDFQSDVERLDEYPIVPEDKEEFGGKFTIDLFNHDNGSFLVSFKDKWKPGKKITIGFSSTITYSAGTNTITCRGGTEGDPIDFWDLWNASDVNGWDVVNNTCDTQFKFWCKLVIGDGSTETWFADINKQVVFSDVIITASWQIIIRVMNNANFRLGVCVDVVEHITSDGCSIHDEVPVRHHSFIKTQSNSAEIELYSSQFIGSSIAYENVIWAVGSAGAVYNCELISMALRGGGEYWNIYNVRISQAMRGLNRVTFATLDKVTVEGCRYGILTQFGNLLNLRNSIVRTSVVESVHCNFLSINNNFIDCDLDVWSFTWDSPSTAAINRQYTFNLLVVNEAGSPLENANVTLYEADDDVAFTVLTGADGTIAEQVVTRGYYNQTGGNTLYDYGPHELVVTYEGMSSTTANITLSDPVDWTVAIQEPGGWNVLSLVAIFLVTVVLIGVKMR